MTAAVQFDSMAPKVAPFTPEPGVHADTSLMMYHNVWTAASNSGLTLLKRSPAHYLASRQQAGKTTEALAIGHAIHVAVLEPDSFHTAYTVAGQCEALVASGKNAGNQCGNSGLIFRGAWFCGVHSKGLVGSDDGRIVLSSDDHRIALSIRDSVYRHPAARHLLKRATMLEASMAWDDKETGVRCKARMDAHVNIFDGAIADVKSTIDARRDEFERSIYKYGYHRQGALYLSGAEAVQLPAKDFINIAVEKEPPYAVAVYRLTEGALDAGMQQVRPLLTTYAECLRTNEWPAYSDNIEQAALPSWAWDKIEQEGTDVSQGVAA